VEGHATFSGERTVEVTLHDGSVRTLQGKRVVVNTGARPFLPPIKGIDAEGVPTSTSIMELDAVPDHLVVLGGGYIGLEFGQMFRRFSADVTIIERGDQVLGREDASTAEAVQDVMEQSGIQVHLGSSVTQIVPNDDGSLSVVVEGKTGVNRLRGTHLLVAAGRRPNTDNLGLGAADIDTTDRGHIVVDDRLETSAEGVFAIGDVKGGPAFTHISYDDYRILRDRWLHDELRSMEVRRVPYTVFIDPQLGRIGLSGEQAQEKDRDVQVVRMPMSRVARAIETGETHGFMEAVVDNETGRLLGATVFGPEGGEIASLLQVAMMGDLPYTAVLGQKILQDGDFDFLLLDHSLQFRDFLLLLLQLVGVAEGLGAVFFQLRPPTGECHWMNVVGPSDLRVCSIGLERFAYDLKRAFGTAGTSTHGAYRFDSRFTENEASCVPTSVLVGSSVQFFARGELCRETHGLQKTLSSSPFGSPPPPPFATRVRNRLPTAARRGHRNACGVKITS